MNTTRLKPIVILTGAGISAESGIRTFRAADGLWEDHRIDDVATPEAFHRDPALVQRFYNLRRAQLLEAAVAPNAGHLALSRLEQEWEGDFLLVTQNVDNLHERAGSQRLLHMHGELQKLWCLSCDQRSSWTQNVTEESLCPACAQPLRLRPDIVWFGEIPYHMDVIEQALEKCELFLSIGTSGNVYPASGFVRWARHAHKIEVNPASTPVSDDFDEHLRGPAGETLPRLVDRLLNS